MEQPSRQPRRSQQKQEPKTPDTYEIKPGEHLLQYPDGSGYMFIYDGFNENEARG
jgi:hypothetical protein